MSADSNCCWQLAGTLATLTRGPLYAQIDLQRPWLGLRELRFGAASVVGSILAPGVESDGGNAAVQDKVWRPTGAFVRGCDLVVTYHEPLGQRFILQMHLRGMASCSAAAELEALLSLQTREWEAYPAVTLTTSLKCRDVILGDSFAAYLLNSDGSYVEAARPEDFTLSATPSPMSGLSTVTWRYGNQFMERGVIRRLRLRAGFVATDTREYAVKRLLNQLAADEPPLTA